MSVAAHTPVNGGDLMVDALNVWQETGLTPRQLADELAKLKKEHASQNLAAGKEISKMIERYSSQSNKLLEALKEAKKRLTQSLGIIVEFGDLNGFRYTTDAELGKMVVEMVRAGAETLNKIETAIKASGGQS